MDTEFAALAASGATTLVSLMVTDSWAQARDLVGRLFSRTGAGTGTVADLDAARARLLAADDAGAAHEITDRWRADLYRLLRTGCVTSDDLHDVLSSLRQLGGLPGALPASVHNDITGGVQHGPVIQSGRITGLTLHVHNPDHPVQD